MKYYEIMKEMVRSAQWGAVTRLILKTLFLGFLLTYSLVNIWITVSEHWYQVGAMLRIGVLSICAIAVVNVMMHY